MIPAEQEVKYHFRSNECLEGRKKRMSIFDFLRILYRKASLVYKTKQEQMVAGHTEMFYSQPLYKGGNYAGSNGPIKFQLDLIITMLWS